MDVRCVSSGTPASSRKVNGQGPLYIQPLVFRYHRGSLPRHFKKLEPALEKNSLAEGLKMVETAGCIDLHD